MGVRWSVLKRFVTSQYARLIAIIPLVGWLLVLNDRFAQALARLTGVSEIATPSWQLYAFHIGLSVFGLGVMLFYLCCPNAIKNSTDLNDFIAQESVTLTKDRFETYHKATKPLLALLPVASGFDVDPDSHELWSRRNRHNILNVLDQTYQQADKLTVYGLQYLVALLLIIGFIVSAIPSLMTILWSVGRLMQTVAG